MKKLMFVLLFAIANLLNAQEVTGDWNGALEVQGMQLRIVFHVNEEGGKYSSTMDSPDQGATGIPTDKTTFENGKLTIEAGAMKLKYEAQLKEAGKKLEGTFNQGGMSFPLVLSRAKVEKKAIIRPQNPTEFSYQQEEVKFVNPKGGHHLAGTLTIPENGKFDKVAILITGSGPQNRDEELIGHKPFLVLSDYFTRNGMAVLRYDDRGVAESGGKFKGATSRDFADDANAAVTFLKTRKDMNGKAIGLAGHSEGGMIAPMVASENPSVDFIVLLAGPGIPIKELMMLQTDKIAEAEGAPEKMRKLNAMVMDKAFGFLQNSKTTDKEELKKGLFKIFDELYVELTDEEKEELGTKEEFFEGEAKMMLSDWFLYFMRFEPADYLSKVKCPVLAVNGELDLQVTSQENLEGIRQSMKAANNTNATIHEFKGLNHLFQKCKTGAPSEYGSIEETFNEEAMAFVTKWILNN